MSEPLNHEQEVQRIEEVYGPAGPTAIAGLLERQFTVLHNRAQVLLGLCGIVITTTGFSGRLIAGTNTAAQLLIIAGVGLVLASGAVVVWGVLTLRWLTQQPGDDVTGWLRVSLLYRDRKTAWYRRAIALLILGLVLYVIALSLMLLDPNAAMAIPGR